ncbi:hypothetical protein Zmor_001718 [Zophobas morio]|uniref:Uncharacterized protein n=1 Tax=Zophobas morio TaxID=2755281 RepID=A0AA38J2G3_9CUCU|nr:hypothetical protein Zmor_001718 [Zophobas morio]
MMKVSGLLLTQGSGCPVDAGYNFRIALPTWTTLLMSDLRPTTQTSSSEKRPPLRTMFDTRPLTAFQKRLSGRTQLLRDNAAEITKRQLYFLVF